jgi:hypothetical protein
MTGGPAAHSAIKGNVAFALDGALRRGSCRALLSDFKVLNPTAVMYPDVLVARRPLAPDDDRLSDPTAVVEVLSPASGTFDRIYKWREYSAIASFKHYVLIEQKERRIEIYSRTATARNRRAPGRRGRARCDRRPPLARGGLREQRPLSMTTTAGGRSSASVAADQPSAQSFLKCCSRIGETLRLHRDIGWEKARLCGVQ